MICRRICSLPIIFTCLVGALPSCKDLKPHRADGDNGVSRSPQTPDSGTSPALQNVEVCKRRKSPQALVTSVVQDLGGRQPNEEELEQAQGKDFRYEAFVDNVLKSALFDDGIAKFVTNLFRLDSLKGDGKDAEKNAETEDLKQEAVVLVQRNRERPWSYFFKTRDVYCTERTAKLYDYPLVNTTGFVSCKLPKERAGFLSLVSVLRSTSPANNPQAFYKTNNNYHRVASAIYFAKGIQMSANTNGPKGDGPLVPTASCFPTTDKRTAKSGLIFGSAAIPLAGSLCSSCHSPDMGPLSVAFRAFGTQGELLSDEDVQIFAAEGTNVTPPSDLADILKEQSSCWSPDGKVAPQKFDGLAGLGQVIAASSTLGGALAMQIPQHLSNTTPSAEMAASIERSFNESGGTLKGAIRGFLLSESYLCERNQ